MWLLDYYKRKRAEKMRLEDEEQRQEIVRKSVDLFQLMEFDGEIWLTYDGHLVCPSDMMKDDPVTAVGEMRELYIKRESV